MPAHLSMRGFWRRSQLSGHPVRRGRWPAWRRGRSSPGQQLRAVPRSARPPGPERTHAWWSGRWPVAPWRGQRHARALAPAPWPGWPSGRMARPIASGALTCPRCVARPGTTSVGKGDRKVLLQQQLREFVPAVTVVPVHFYLGRHMRRERGLRSGDRVQVVAAHLQAFRHEVGGPASRYAMKGCSNLCSNSLSMRGRISLNINSLGVKLE